MKMIDFLQSTVRQLSCNVSDDSELTTSKLKFLLSKLSMIYSHELKVKFIDR